MTRFMSSELKNIFNRRRRELYVTSRLDGEFVTCFFIGKLHSISLFCFEGRMCFFYHELIAREIKGS